MLTWSRLPSLSLSLSLSLSHTFSLSRARARSLSHFLTFALSLSFLSLHATSSFLPAPATAPQSYCTAKVLKRNSNPTPRTVHRSVSQAPETSHRTQSVPVMWEDSPSAPSPRRAHYPPLPRRDDEPAYMPLLGHHYPVQGGVPPRSV